MELEGGHDCQDVPFGVAHLDFGARDGSGVVGPKIDVVDAGRQADKFLVKEGSRLLSRHTAGGHF